MKKIDRQPNQIPASLKNINLQSVLRRRGIYLKQRYNQELKEAAIPIAKQILKSKKSKTKAHRYNNQFTIEDINNYVGKQIHVVETIEQHFENKLNQFIGRIEKGFLAHLEDEIGQRKTAKGQLKKLTNLSVKDYFDDNEEALKTQAQVDFVPLLDNVATVAGKQALDLINHPDVYVPLNYHEVIKKNVDKFATSLIDTDKEVLTNYLAEGIDNGESVAEIRKRITDNFAQYNKMQAERITRTEVMRVSNQASLDAWQQSGVVEGKQWVISGAIDECEAYDGQIETLDGNFYSTSEFADGDPPLHPNCKCVLIPIVIK